MTERPERAVARVRALPPETQDEVARVPMNLAEEAAEPVALSQEDRAATARPKARSVSASGSS